MHDKGPSDDSLTAASWDPNMAQSVNHSHEGLPTRPGCVPPARRSAEGMSPPQAEPAVWHPGLQSPLQDLDAVQIQGGNVSGLLFIQATAMPKLSHDGVLGEIFGRRTV